MKPRYALISLILPAAGALALPDDYIDLYGDAFTPVAVAEAVRTEEPMTLDGVGDEPVWASAPEYALGYATWPVPSGIGWDDPVNGTPAEPDDLNASFKAAWDDEYLYILVEVTDDIIVIDDTDTNYENDDGVEFYLDGDNSRDKGTAWNQPGYDFVNDRQLKIKADNSTLVIGGLYDPQENGTVVVEQDIVVDRTFVETDTGYTVELRMNFSGIFRDFFADGSMVQEVDENTYFGFDIKVSDDDDGGERDITHGWAADSNNSYSDTTLFGTMVLTAGGGDEPGILTPGEWTQIDFGWVFGVTDDWGISTYMGYVYVADFPYVHQVDLGWMYLVSSSGNDHYFYTWDKGWILINEGFGGYYYIYSTDDYTQQIPQP